MATDVGVIWVIMKDPNSVIGYCLTDKEAETLVNHLKKDGNYYYYRMVRRMIYV